MSTTTEGGVFEMSTPLKEIAARVETLPEVMSEAGAVLSMIERAARDPNVDIDKLERLMRMKQEITAQQAEREFNEAMGRAQSEIPQVARDAQNDHTRSRYARLETINAAITPIITRHGFSLSFDTEDSAHQGHYRLICTVARGGFSRRYHADLPSDAAGSGGKVNKTAIQAFGSTISYGRRYLTLMIFNVALANEDNDGNAARREDVEHFIDAEQVEEIMGLVARAGADIPRFCKYLRVSSISEIPASKYEAAVAALKAKEAKR